MHIHNSTTTRHSCMHHTFRIFTRNYRSLKLFLSYCPISSFMFAIYTFAAGYRPNRSYTHHTHTQNHTANTYTHNNTTTHHSCMHHSLRIFARNYRSLPTFMSHCPTSSFLFTLYIFEKRYYPHRSCMYHIHTHNRTANTYTHINTTTRHSCMYHTLRIFSRNYRSLPTFMSHCPISSFLFVLYTFEIEYHPDRSCVHSPPFSIGNRNNSSNYSSNNNVNITTKQQ